MTEIDPKAKTRKEDYTYTGTMIFPDQKMLEGLVIVLGEALERGNNMFTDLSIVSHTKDPDYLTSQIDWINFRHRAYAAIHAVVPFNPLIWNKKRTLND